MGWATRSQRQRQRQREIQRCKDGGRARAERGVHGECIGEEHHEVGMAKGRLRSRGIKCRRVARVDNLFRNTLCPPQPYPCAGPAGPRRGEGRTQIELESVCLPWPGPFHGVVLVILCYDALSPPLSLCQMQKSKSCFYHYHPRLSHSQARCH